MNIENKNLGFYVINDLNKDVYITERFVDFNDAVKAFLKLDSNNGKMPTMGVEVPTGSIDLIHKINGENVLVRDFLNIERFSRELQAVRGEIENFAKKLIDEGIVKYRYCHSILPWRDSPAKTIVPVVSGFIPDAYCNDKTLKAGDGIAATAINEILVDGEGWVNFKDFHKDPSKYIENGVLKVEKLNVAYVKSDRYVGVDGQMDLSVDNFEAMAEKINKAYYISVSDIKNSRYDRSNFAVLSFDTLPEAVKAWYAVNEKTEFTPGVRDRKAGNCVFNGCNEKLEEISFEEAAKMYGFELDEQFSNVNGFCVNVLKDEERSYTFRQSEEINAAAGLIGFIRADFGSGKEFWSSWNEFSSSRKTSEFAKELDTVINALRFDEKYNGILKDIDSLARYCWSHKDTAYEDGRNNYGVRIDTDKYSYLMRLIPTRGDYNVYCYCYQKELLNEHLLNAEKVANVDKLIDNAVKASKNTLGDGKDKENVDLDK